jgi:transposase
MLIHSTVADTARKLGGSEETIDGILDRWIERAVNWTAWAWLGMIGIDKIARNRGHRHVVVLVTVPLAGGGVEILAVLADRQQETVAAFLRAIPEPLRHTIECACTAMDEGFVSAIEEEVPGAEIVMDRFPVARASRDGADTVRKQDSSGSSERGPRPSTPRSRGRCGRFVSGLGSSSRTHGRCSSGCLPTRRRSTRPTTCEKT